MSFFDVLTLIGGLCLFLFGMNVMGESLERRAGDKLSAIIGRLTTNKIAGFLTGLGVTAIIQTGGSVKDQDSIDLCNEYDIPMVFSGYRHFRH